MKIECSELKPWAQRFGQVALIRPDKIDKYKELHASVCPEVLEGLEKYRVNNYSIYLKDLEQGKPYLFGYFEYSGDDFEGDMAKMLQEPKVQEWENIAGGGCLIDQSLDGKGLWWVDMEEVH